MVLILVTTASKPMVWRLRTLLILAAVGCAPCTPPQANAGDARPSQRQGSLKVTLVREHKQATLEAISRKSATMIVWDSERPTLKVRIPSPGPQRREPCGRNRMEQSSICSGKDISIMPVGFLPTVRYFPNEDRVIFEDDIQGEYQVRIWDFVGKTRTCLEGRPAIELIGITPVSEEE